MSKINDCEIMLKAFLLSEDLDPNSFLENQDKDLSINQIFNALIDLFLNTETNNIFLRNRTLMFLNAILKVQDISIEKNDKITLDSLLGQTSYLTNFAGLDNELVAGLIERKNIFNRITLVDKKEILGNRGIKENDDEFSCYEKGFMKENELFGIHAYDLLPINYFNLDDSKKHAFLTPSFINYNPIFQDTFLIFSYIGKNLCREFYTGKLVNLDEFDSGIDCIYSKINDETLNASVKSFRAIDRSPLGIKSGVFRVDDKIKNLILRQSDRKEEIKAAINEMYDRVLEKNKINIARVVAQDYSEAQELDRLEYDLAEFKKDTKKLFLEKEEELSEEKNS